MNAQHNGPIRPSRELIIAAILEAFCIMGGIGAYLATGNWIWIVIGVVAGLGFSAPAVVKLLRQRAEDRHAPR